jgi:membrane-anchored glycerophosphoryl diester phosphodiesterase (GDPDase)
LGELVGMVQRNVLHLCFIMLLLGMAESLITLPLFFGPLRFRLTYAVIAGLALFFINLRIFPMPFLIVLENTRLRDLFRLSWKLTQNQTPRLIRLCLVILFIQFFVAIAMLVNPFAGLMVLSINIFALILSTLFFQDLWKRAQLSG